MSISPQILRHASALDPQQLDVVGHLEGPLLVRAGPGAGKTRVLVWRLVNLLLQDVCGPDEIVLMAFGTLAAAEMRQRVAAAARSVGYCGDVDRIKISTIHAMSHRILSAHHRRVGLKSGYAVLNREERQGFLNENFDSIFGSRERSLAVYGWKKRQQILDNAVRCFDLITEEDIPPGRLVDSGNAYHELIGLSYLDYEDALLKCGYADFSHLLLWADDVLSDARIADDYGMGMRHIMVDEYQDVSRLMELILLRLAEYHGNAAVVGDIHQSIYRFRGAGPEAMLGFNEHFPDCRVVTLDTNYRSHPGIVRACNRLIAHNQRRDGDARALGAAYFMFPSAPDTRADYPAAVTVFGWDVGDEMAELIDVVKFLHSHDIVSDYSDIVLLLHSVKERVSGSYVKAFTSAGIPVHRSNSSAGDPSASDRSKTRARERFPKGQVCISTMHASKGLEWPVVIVATAEPLGQTAELDNALRRYSRRCYQEPVDHIAANDRRRQYYVACTRAQNMLVLTGNGEHPPSPAFDSVWHDLPRWSSINQAQLVRQRFGSRESDDSQSVTRTVTIDRLEHVRWQPKSRVPGGGVKEPV